MNYWIIEMIKVFLAYMFVLFVWPSVVFYKYFRNKSLSQRFLICTIGVPIAITTLVIMLGLFHLLYQLIFVIGFYVIFAVQLYRMLDIPQEFFLHIKYLMTGSMKFKTFVFQINDWIRERSGNWIRKWWGLIRPHFLECVILFIISCYALIYFGIGCFEVTSYGASDMYVHHSWIYGLKQGKIFVNGIYPEGMHCLIYLMNTVFGIKIYDILLLLQPIHTSFVLFVSIYLFIKELTYSSFSGIYALILFAVMKVDRINM
ncbi:MAG: hypothetical protein J6Z03_06680, partial [Erysipelotrichaceae bacterium]|nr:hypothetical protein [Erysipelotrichaceae bacterium]